MSRGKSRVSNLTIQQICNHYSITKSFKITAKMFGLSESTVRKIINKTGAYKQSKYRL